MPQPIFSEDNFPTPKPSLSSKQSGAWKSEVPLTAVRLLHVTAECLRLQNSLEDTAGPSEVRPAEQRSRGTRAPMVTE